MDDVGYGFQGHGVSQDKGAEAVIAHEIQKLGLWSRSVAEALDEPSSETKQWQRSVSAGRIRSLVGKSWGYSWRIDQPVKPKPEYNLGQTFQMAIAFEKKECETSPDTGRPYNTCLALLIVKTRPSSSTERFRNHQCSAALHIEYSID